MGKTFLIFAATYIIPVLLAGMPGKMACCVAEPAGPAHEVVLVEKIKAKQEPVKEGREYRLVTDAFFLHI